VLIFQTLTIDPVGEWTTKFRDARPVRRLTYRVFQKTETQFYFWDNFGNSAPILTILSLLQTEIYGA